MFTEFKNKTLALFYRITPRLTAVSNGGGKVQSLCLSSLGPHHCQTRETPVFYPKKVSAQYHRGVQQHPNGGSPGSRRSNASSH
ncbi:hypothetical protein AVEN_227344-1 [Araneus ventricosus]|uniref:Uncharacterized protein n=1 Tax=Araneus ventricosus TaxID=182803 RepID=A0A4Y2GUP5_ARAVE|nr:hypothetical protein AVEN_227344-1 [Araneus ventricosus]